jgi:Reverse transcriptase (RNA-dependent DNA polymerase)
MALVAALCMYVYILDAVNAYANAPGPTVKTYVYIDDAYADWYYKTHGYHIDRRCVLPVNGALQGHPESGALWERTCDAILQDLGFKSTTHERNLFHATINGHLVLLCRQVDDIAIACADPATAQSIIKQIGDKIKVKTEGLLTRFNGVDVGQYAEYVQISCTTYLRRMLESHGWDTPQANESEHTNLSSVPDSLASRIDTTAGPLEHTVEARELAESYGFSFRSVLGELMFAYVVARPDIGYVVTRLSKFSTKPSEIHYQVLKAVCRYLRRTIHWGIVYWRPQHLRGLTNGPLRPYVNPDSKLPTFPGPLDALILTGYFDAAHATDLETRRSVSGIIFTLCGAAIAYTSKLQPTVATSSTEAEFIAAVLAGKMAKLYRMILEELGFKQSGPTTLYGDNEAAILMTNANKPTPRARHIDIQYFAIQEWKQLGYIVLAHIAGIINMADALTKLVGWILTHRHCRQMMGHCLPTYAIPATPSASPVSTDIAPVDTSPLLHSVEAGEGVGAMPLIPVMQDSSVRIPSQSDVAVPATAPVSPDSGHDSTAMQTFTDP